MYTTHVLSHADDAPGYDLATATCLPPTSITAPQVELEASKEVKSVHQELCEYYTKAEQRLQAVGQARFFGNE